MKVSVLGSGSRGNSTYISTPQTTILVDLGFGWRSLRRRLTQLQLEVGEIDAILLTHGHSDHVSGVPGVLAKRGVPVFMNQGTRSEVAGLEKIQGWRSFRPGLSFSIGDIQVKPFSVSHDAAEPVGFRFTADGVTGALVTDLGELDSSVTPQLKGCNWLILESNHDEEMLKVGPYPWNLKQRVLSPLGHLSNQSLSHFLADHFDGQATDIFLAHLSQTNNHPSIALEAAHSALRCRSQSPLYAVKVHLTHQSQPTAVLQF